MPLIPSMNSYMVSKLEATFPFDSCWDKAPWQSIPSLVLSHHMGVRPGHFPKVKAKLAYNDEALFVIFRVADRYVCARKQGYQEMVCEDSCVEFFFTPGEDISAGYFNLEVNCGGTALFHHQKGRGLSDVPVSQADFSQVQLAHSLPKVVDPEISDPTTWVVEYCLPFSILAKYTPLKRPGPGAIWRANLYKCADKCSQPHWLTWAPVDLPKPDFHQPGYFGQLVFG